MKKIISILAMLAMLLSLCTGALAENTLLAGQAKDADVTEFYYDKAGERTVGTGFPTSGNAVARVSKTIESAGVENEFLVTLNVQTTQDIRKISSSKTDAAIMLIIDASSSMTYCADCGSMYQHGSYGYDHAFETRFSQAKKNVKQLIDTFSVLDEAHGGSRYLSIVAYNGSAYTVMDWLDVADPANCETAKGYVEGIATGSGTNIEAGLMLGANVWNHTAVNDIDYKYTVLLTDGQPTRYVPGEDTISRDEIEGSSYTRTDENAVADVGYQADRILADGLLYSICIGDVADKTYFEKWDNAYPKTTKEMTVLQWLDEFSTSASRALNTDEMLSSFETITSQIQMAAQAWKVDDEMGPHAVFVERVGPQGLYSKYEVKDGVLHWDVLGSHVQNVTEIGKDSVQLEYSFVYKVKLDNLNTQYQAETWTDANKEALLSYAVLDNNTGLWQLVDPVEFPVPKMKGYEGELEFTKVYMDDGRQVPIAGMTFELRSNDRSAAGATWRKTATSGRDGKVSFTDIPSGHSYTLAETNAGSQGFVDPSDMTVTVALGEVSSALQGGTLVNTKSDRDVSLEIIKEFEGLPDDVRPESITIEARHGDHTHTAVLDADNGWTATLTGLEPDAEYTITEKDAEIDGYTMSVTALVDGAEVNVDNASVKKVFRLDADQSHQTFTIEFTNAYTRKEGEVSIRKVFMERTGVDANNRPILEALNPERYAGKSVTIELRDAKNVPVRTVTLPQNGQWEAELKNLPEGVYTVHETATADIDDHEFVHVHLEDANGNELEGHQVTITDGAELNLVLENHYMHLVGEILVIKDFALQGGAQGETVAVPQNKKFEIDVYDQWTQNDDGSYTPVGNPVDTIEVYKRESGDWLGTSKSLSFGSYLLVEDTTNTEITGYDFKGAAFDSQVVEVASTTQAARSRLTNTYEKKTGTITVKKEWMGENLGDKQPQLIDIHIHNENNQHVTTLTLSGTSNPAWEATTAPLPLGTYYLSEETRVKGGAKYNTADVPGYGHESKWPNGSTVVLSDETLTKELTIENHYKKKYGTLTIEKVFNGLPEDVQSKMGISFLVEKSKRGTHGKYELVDTIELSTETGWSETIHLPVLPGNETYRLRERGAYAPEGSGYTFDKMVIGSTALTIQQMMNGTGYEFALPDYDEENGTSPIVSLTATNHYTRDKGSLTISKAFNDDPDTDEAKAGLSAIDVLLYQDGTPVRKVTLTQPEWTETISDLPTGDYTLVEVHSQNAYDPKELKNFNSAYVDGYNLTHSWSGGAQVTVVKDQTTAPIKTVTNTYTKKTGLLTVSKRFDGLPQDKWPSVTISAMQGDKTVKSITLGGSNWRGTMTLPIGKYKLVETAEGVNGYTHSVTSFQVGTAQPVTESPDVTVKEGANQHTYVYLTNTYTQDVGTITVTKSFTNDDATNDAKAQLSEINVLVKDAQKNTVQTLTLTANTDPEWTATTDPLPVGTYTLEEVESTALVSGYTLVSSWSNGNEVTVTKDSNKSATLTNTYTQDVGSVQVTKTVESAYASDLTKAFTFKMTVDPAINGQFGDMTFANGVATFTLSHGKAAVAANIPAGAAWIVEEASEAGFTTMVGGEVGSGARGMVEGNTTVPFVNKRVSDQQLTISKKVDSALRSDYEKRFSFTISLNDESVKGEFDATVNGESRKVTFTGGKAAVELKHGEAMTIAGLPKGMGFRVSEQASEDFVSTATESNASVVDGVIGTDLTATFVNTRAGAAADLTVSKTVAGKNANPQDVFTFEVKIADLMDGQYGDMTFAGGVATVTLKHGQKAVAAGIPAGVAFTVTETDFGAYTPNVTEYTGTLSAKGFEAAFVNTLELPELPETGDKSSILLWGAMLAMAGAALLMLKRRDA